MSFEGLRVLVTGSTRGIGRATAAAFHAESDRLAFGAARDGRQSFLLEGFTSPDIRVVDLGDPARPVWLEGGRVEPGEQAGRYRIRLTDETERGRPYLAWAEGSGERPPAAIRRNEASRLRDPDRGADYLIVTHASLVEAVEAHQSIRAAHQQSALEAELHGGLLTIAQPTQAGQLSVSGSEGALSQPTQSQPVLSQPKVDAAP